MEDKELLQEEEASIITFVDENGEDITMEYLDCIEYQGKEYLALLDSLDFNKCIGGHADIMTKEELVNAIAIQTGYDKTTIMNVVESAVENIKSTVAAGESVYLRGFGSFTTKVRKQKIARNITKKESIVVPEHKIPSIKPDDSFTEL